MSTPWIALEGIAQELYIETVNPTFPELPLELGLCVWEKIGLTPYSSFNIVANGTARLVEMLKAPGSRDVVFETGKYLSAKMISSFGTDFIEDIVLSDECIDYKNSSKILGAVKALKFATSLSGVCALKLFGSGWETEWIGKVPVGSYVWFGMIHGKTNTYSCSFNVSAMSGFFRGAMENES